MGNYSQIHHIAYKNIKNIIITRKTFMFISLITKFWNEITKIPRTVQKVVS